MSPEQYALEYCGRLKKDSPRLYNMFDYCVRTKQPWKLSGVLKRLPNALDLQIGGQDIVNYLIRLEDRSEQIDDVAYSGSAWGFSTSLYLRARDQNSPAKRAYEHRKLLYKAWDYDDLGIVPHIGIMCVHLRASVSRYGNTPLLLDETMHIGLFAVGCHERAHHTIRCIPPALNDSTAEYDEVLQHAMDCVSAFPIAR